jgi:hypothetical protein
VNALRQAGLVVMGLSDDWRAGGLGRARATILEDPQLCALVLRSGVNRREGERREETRYSWSRTGVRPHDA